MSESESRQLEIAIGVFVLVALAAIAGMIFVFGGGGGFFSETYTVRARFDHIGDLLADAPVKLGGVRIGRVSEIALQADGKVVAVLSLGAEKSVVLRTGTKAFIGTAGIVGATFIELIGGDGDEPLPRDGSAVIEGRGQPTTAELLDRIRSIGEGLETFTQHANDIIGEDAFKQNIRETVHATARTAKAAQRFLTDLKRTSENITMASEDVLETTNTIKRVSVDIHGAIQKTITDENNIAALRETLHNARTASREVAVSTQHLNAILARTDRLFQEEEPRFRNSLENVETITRDLRGKLAAIQTDKGLLRYFTSDGINARLDGLFDRIQAGLDHVGTLLKGTSKVGLFAAYRKGARIGDKQLREYGRMPLDEVMEEEWRKEQEALRRRKEVLEQMEGR